MLGTVTEPPTALRRGCVDLSCQREIELGDPARIVRAEREMQRAPADIDIRMVVCGLSGDRDSVDHGDRRREAGAFHRAVQGGRITGPARQCRQTGGDLFRR